MNKKQISQLILGAAVAGLVTGAQVSSSQAASADQVQNAPDKDKHACEGKDGCGGKEKDSCKGKDKNSCKGKDKNSCKGKDKNSCKGKDDKNSCKSEGK